MKRKRGKGWSRDPWKGKGWKKCKRWKWWKRTAIPAHTSPPLLFVMSMGQFDHPFWFNARPMVTKIDAMSVSKQAHVRMGVDSTGDDWESPGLPTDISGKSVGFKRYRSSRWGETSQSHTTELPTTRA